MTVALVHGSVGQETGATPLARQGVHEAIQLAIELQLLGNGSNARCLIVPAHDVKKGPLDSTSKACPIPHEVVMSGDTSRLNRDV